MPRKTKTTNELNEVKPKSSSKKVEKEVKSTTKKKAAKKTTTPKTKTTTKATQKKSTTTKTTKTKSVAKTTKSKTSTTTKKPTTKATKAKTTTRTKKTASSIKKSTLMEYYDLPYSYNKTFVKILAQTPNTLFVYWEISDEDKKSFVENYGENFFNTTKPVLVVHNKTKNYTFEIDINDFANSWYFNVNDTKCEYEIELGRRFIEASPSKNNYTLITSSNKIEVPNDHILFEKEQNTIFFKNVKTNNTYSKQGINLHFMKHAGNVHKIYNFYNKIYKEENFENIKNPTSGFTNF